MWHVFAVHLRAGWVSAATTSVNAKEVVVDKGVGAQEEVDVSDTGGSRETRLLARELDGEIFVLFLRNLHVTSSVAGGVGELCSRLAEEVRKLTSFLFWRVHADDTCM